MFPASQKDLYFFDTKRSNGNCPSGGHSSGVAVVSINQLKIDELREDNSAKRDGKF